MNRAQLLAEILAPAFAHPERVNPFLPRSFRCGNETMDEISIDVSLNYGLDELFIEHQKCVGATYDPLFWKHMQHFEVFDL